MGVRYGTGAGQCTSIRHRGTEKRWGVSCGKSLAQQAGGQGQCSRWCLQLPTRGWQLQLERQHLLCCNCCLEDADRLPPSAAHKQPDGEVEHTEDEAELVPLGLRHVAGAVEGGGRADAVGGQAAHHVGQLACRHAVGGGRSARRSDQSNQLQLATHGATHGRSTAQLGVKSGLYQRTTNKQGKSTKQGRGARQGSGAKRRAGESSPRARAAMRPGTPQASATERKAVYMAPMWAAPARGEARAWAGAGRARAEPARVSQGGISVVCRYLSDTGGDKFAGLTAASKAPSHHQSPATPSAARLTRGKEVVGVEVEGQDGAKGGLPAHAQPAHKANHLRGGAAA